MNRILFKSKLMDKLTFTNISVIMPCHNAERKIRPMLTSLELQDVNVANPYTAQYIFVIDSCTDGTLSVILQHFPLEKFPLIIVETDAHCPGGAREAGRQYAIGQYTWFVDCDDFLLADDALSTCIYTLDHYPTHPYLHVRNVTSYDDYAAYYYNVNEHFQETGTVWSYVFRTDFIKEFHFNNEQIYEDKIFLDQVKEKALKENPNFKMFRTNASFYYYNSFSPNSQTHKDGCETRIDCWRERAKKDGILK